MEIGSRVQANNDFYARVRKASKNGGVPRKGKISGVTKAGYAKVLWDGRKSEVTLSFAFLEPAKSTQ